MEPRTISGRPLIIVDDRAVHLVDEKGNHIGWAGPLGRERVVFALLMGNGPQQIDPGVVLDGRDGAWLVDPDGFVVGEQSPFWCSRMLGARWTEDTRRLAG